MSIYPVSPAAHQNAAAANSSTGSSNSTTSATDYTSMFMQLLSTELQSQDPTQTMDPTTMVTQMVQINQLSDVAGIYSILQGQGGSTGIANGSTADASSKSQSAQNAIGGN